MIENDLYRITFSNRGAQVKSWILKKYDNDTENGPLDLVNQAAAKQYGYPLSLYAYDEDLRGRLSSELYVTSSEGKLTPPATLTYEYADDVMSVRKTFTFDNTYVVKIDASVTYKGSPAAALPAWPAGFGDQTTPAFYGAGMISYQFNKNIERVAAKKVSGGGTIPGPLHWAGPTDLYFAAVFIPDDPASAALITLRNSLPIITDAQKNEKANVDVLGAAVGNLHGPTFDACVRRAERTGSSAESPGARIGRQRSERPGRLRLVGHDLEAALYLAEVDVSPHRSELGMGDRPADSDHQHRAAAAAYHADEVDAEDAARRTADQVDPGEIQEVQPADPRKAAMNEEISAIYKREGVNPAGGCLPMLIQFPFLIAYYRMLGAAIDLRHAHWLWINDLSAAESFPYILPVLMVVSMVVVQRMTPQAGMDPAQQRLMTVMMPLMMGFIFFRLAGWPEPVLRGSKPDFDRATGSHESNLAGPRNARDDGQAREEEREVSYQLSALSFQLDR